MSTTSRQPYSDRALDSGAAALALGMVPLTGEVAAATAVLDTAHDRSRLGLDASARVGDVLDEVVALLRSDEAIQLSSGELAARFLLREFEANEARS
jgi:hypothetical protein